VRTVNRGLLMRELPDSERPRERMERDGADSLANSDLIAILLRTGTKGISVMDVAKQLVQKFGTLDNLSRASIAELRQIKGIGRD
jgi:DNA repair protein RadC